MNHPQPGTLFYSSGSGKIGIVLEHGKINDNHNLIYPIVWVYRRGKVYDVFQTRFDNTCTTSIDPHIIIE